MDLLNLTPDRFKNLMATLTPEEQNVIIQILREYADTGESKTYNTVWLEDYEEIPVDIDTFLESEDYLGLATNYGKQIYPFWREQLRKMFSTGDMDYEEVAFTGAIGIGKTAIAVYAIAYLLYRLLCLRNPQRYFGFADTDEIAIFFFNATVALATGVGYARLHATCMESPWFKLHGEIKGSKSNPYYVPGKHISIKAGSKASHGLGQQIFCGMLDEVNFAPGANVAFEKSKIMQTYSSVKARIKSRFIKNGKLLGKMFLVSSKHAEHDFLEVYLQKRKHEADADRLFIVDEPLWVVKPPGTYCGKTFKVAYGAKQLEPMLVSPDESEEGLVKMGYKILNVPVEFEEDFKLNIVVSLQDLAGIALPGTTSYFSYRIFSKCYTDRENPFSNEILQIGLDDPMEYEEFFDVSLIPRDLLRLPIAIHIDTALKHDLLGMSAVAYLKNIISDTDDGLVEKRVYSHLFSVGIQAPPGSEISLAKTRRFLYRLRNLGMNIVVVSTDTFQSAEFHQILKDKGFETAIRSLDRTPEGYQILREAMIENRISLLHCNRLESELIHLQRDSSTGKLDHPPDGSKDISDSLAGAVWDLSLLPYSPGLSNFKMEYHATQSTLPAWFTGTQKLEPLDKYRFERRNEDALS